MRALSRDEFVDPVLIVDLTWAGRVFRFASEPVSIMTDAGDVLHYDGSVGLRWRESVDLEGGLPEEDIELGDVVFPVDVALWHRQGKPLSMATAELSWWAPGRTHESRQPLMRGRVGVSAYGLRDQPVSISIRPPSLSDTALFPPANAVADTSTWSTVDESIAGTPYPFVFGAPGLGVSSLALTGGAPAVLVDATYTSGSDVGKWVINGARSLASTVKLINVTAGESETVDVETTQDGLGRTVSWVTATSGTITVDVTNDYMVDWSGTDGGIPGPDGEAIGGAGDVAILLLRESTVGYDEGAWRAQARSLNRFRFDFYLDEQVSPFGFLRDEILSLLPFGLGRSVDGVVPVPYLLSPALFGATGEAAALEAGRNCEVEDYPVSDGSSIVNEQTIRFAPRADNGEPYYTRTVTGREPDPDEPNVFPALAARVSANTYGQTFAGEPIETEFVYDQATADLIVACIVADKALPPELVTLSIQERLTDLRAGSAVELTVADLYWNATVQQVEEVIRDGQSLTVSVRVRPNIAGDARPF